MSPQTYVLAYISVFFLDLAFLFFIMFYMSRRTVYSGIGGFERTRHEFARTLVKALHHLNLSMLTFEDTDEESEGEERPFEELMSLEGMNEETQRLKIFLYVWKARLRGFGRHLERWV
jgi:hypothetical protein